MNGLYRDYADDIFYYAQTKSVWWTTFRDNWTSLQGRKPAFGTVSVRALTGITLTLPEEYLT